MVKQITGRNNGKGYVCMKERLVHYIRGWITYYRFADMKDFILKTDGWYHRRLRMYIWKSWKRVRTRYKNLQKCGVSKHQAWQWANTRKGYWRISNSPILTTALSNDKLVRVGYPRMIDYYAKLHRS